jgi:hypothetical protein
MGYNTPLAASRALMVNALVWQAFFLIGSKMAGNAGTTMPSDSNKNDTPMRPPPNGLCGGNAK